ncbi:MAG: hypothetical protein FWF05_00665 [Oscillospiraceae bacterium]|nr:hypothetical protein [Oscillospiraceae bacterium]
MFVILQIGERKKDVLSRLKERFSPEEPGLSKIAVRNGAPFFILRVRRRKDGVPWAEVKSAAGKGAARMLYTSDDRPPESMKLRAFEPDRLPFWGIWNSAAGLLKNSGVNPPELRLGIVDCEGELCGELSRAVMLASVVRVVTRKTRLYEAAAEKMMERYGASVLVGSDEAFVENCNFVVRKEGLAIGGHGSSCAVTGSGFELPAEYAGLRPENVDETLFACALYECCGVRALGKQPFENLFWNGTKESQPEIRSKIINILQKGNITP